MRRASRVLVNQSLRDKMLLYAKSTTRHVHELIILKFDVPSVVLDMFVFWLCLLSLWCCWLLSSVNSQKFCTFFSSMVFDANSGSGFLLHIYTCSLMNALHLINGPWKWFRLFLKHSCSGTVSNSSFTASWDIWPMSVTWWGMETWMV